MDHLAEAKRLVARAGQRDGMEEDHFSAQLATAHVLIAWVERMNKAAEDAEIAAEREDLIRERLSQRGGN